MFLYESKLTKYNQIWHIFFLILISKKNNIDPIILNKNDNHVWFKLKALDSFCTVAIIDLTNCLNIFVSVWKFISISIPGSTVFQLNYKPHASLYINLYKLTDCINHTSFSCVCLYWNLILETMQGENSSIVSPDV